MKHIAYIGLGTNLGVREENIESALTHIKAKGITILQKSTILETKAVEYTDQPDFLNMIIKVATRLSPESLLETLLAIENVLGRKREIDKGPRIIDLDLLLYDALLMESSNLILPHPGIKARWFILKHLLELDSTMCDPITKKPYREFYNEKEDRP